VGTQAAATASTPVSVPVSVRKQKRKGMINRIQILSYENVRDVLRHVA
jgi:hypothetical protein